MQLWNMILSVGKVEGGGGGQLDFVTTNFAFTKQTDFLVQLLYSSITFQTVECKHNMLQFDLRISCIK